MTANGFLAGLLHRHDLTYQRFADMVREWCLSAGEHQVSVDRARVHAWAHGEMPRTHYRAAVVAVATDLEGRPVTCAELGWPEIEPPRTDPIANLAWNPPDIVEALCAYPRSVLMISRRGFVEAAGAVAGTTLVAGLADFVTAQPTAASTKTGRVGEETVAGIEASTRLFRNSDYTQGGRVALPAVMGQLTWAADQLHGNYDSRVGRRLFAAIADLFEVGGFMAYDAGLHATAQRCWALGVRAAAAGDDKPAGANLLSDMARQLIDQDRPLDALQVVELARKGARNATPATRAMLDTVEARGHARAGRLGLVAHRTAVARVLRAIDQAYTTFDASDPAEEPEWIQFFRPDGATAVALYDVAHYNRPQRDSAADRSAEAAAGYGTSHARSALFATVRLASLRALQGEYDESRRGALTAIDMAAGIRSARVGDLLDDLRAHIRPHRHQNPRLAEVDVELARAITAQRAA